MDQNSSFHFLFLQKAIALWFVGYHEGEREKKNPSILSANCHGVQQTRWSSTDPVIKYNSYKTRSLLCVLRQNTQLKLHRSHCLAEYTSGPSNIQTHPFPLSDAYTVYNIFYYCVLYQLRTEIWYRTPVQGGGSSSMSMELQYFLLGKRLNFIIEQLAKFLRLTLCGMILTRL